MAEAKMKRDDMKSDGVERNDNRNALVEIMVDCCENVVVVGSWLMADPRRCCLEL